MKGYILYHNICMIISSYLLLIVMINIFIAILSNTYEKI
jgi:hypothetical protein